MIYLDNAATTAMYPECLDDFRKYGVDDFFNPSAYYAPAGVNAHVVAAARKTILSALGAPDGANLLFTASGSESDNIALRCCLKRKKGTVIVSALEHAAVFNTAKALEAEGYALKVAECDRSGAVIEDRLYDLIDEDTVLVSVMHVCNETGALNDVKRIAAEVKRRCPRCVFHSDGVQAFLKVPMTLAGSAIDLYTVSAHKVHGPKGVGALYLAPGVNPSTFVYGGGQEFNLRSGTENVPGIAAFATAVEKGKGLRAQKAEVCAAHKRAIDAFLRANFGEKVRIITDIERSAGGIFHFAFADVRGEVMVHSLEKKGILVGTGSACSSKKAQKRIPDALGLKGGYAEGAIRVSLDGTESEEDIAAFCDALADCRKVLEKYARI